MKVLVIDEDVHVSIVFDLLQARHKEDLYTVCGSLAKAKELLWANKYDIIVMDIMLPADDGLVPGSEAEGGLITGILLMELVQADIMCPNQKTPVLMLTALPTTMHDRIAQTEKAMGSQFLLKPQKPAALYSILKENTHV